MMSEQQKVSRRDFLRQSALGAAAMGLATLAPARVWGANERLNVGVIGCGGRGNGAIDDHLNAEHLHPPACVGNERRGPDIAEVLVAKHAPARGRRARRARRTRPSAPKRPRARRG